MESTIADERMGIWRAVDEEEGMKDRIVQK